MMKTTWLHLLAALLACLLTLTACVGNPSNHDETTGSDTDTVAEETTEAHETEETTSKTDTETEENTTADESHTESDTTGEETTSGETISEETTFLWELELDTSTVTLSSVAYAAPDFEAYEIQSAGALADDVNTAITVTYAVTPEGEDGEHLLAAATVNVLDCRYPVQVAITHRLTVDTVSYTIVDFYGDVLYEGVLTGEMGDVVTLTRGIKNHPTGHFTVTVGDEVTPYVVTPGYDTRTLTDSPFAMGFDSAERSGGSLDMAYALACASRMTGTTWVREDVRWGRVEKEQGVYDYSYVEDYLKAMDRAGFNVLGLISGYCGTSSWTGTESSLDRIGGFAYTQLEFYAFMNDITTHFGDIVDAWELGNEPSYFTRETSELVTAWIKAGALGVYDADPNKIISHAGICTSPVTFENLLFESEMMRYSSVYNYHSHVYQMETLSDFGDMDYVKRTYSLNVLYNPDNKPIWVSEAGMKVYSPPSEGGQRHQAAYIVSSTAESLSMGTDLHYWFVLPPFFELGGEFGMFNADWEPYPTMAAEATMSYVLGEAIYQGELSDLPEGASGYLFYTGVTSRRLVSVAWTPDGLTTTYTFASATPVLVTDIMGKETLVDPVDGMITVELGLYPVYITYTTPPTSNFYHQAYETAEMPTLSFTLGDRVIISPEIEGLYVENDFVIKETGHRIYDGMSFRVRVSNFNDVPVTGTISVTIPGFEIEGLDTELTIQPYDEAFVTLTLRKVDDVAFNDFITFTGTFNGETASPTAAHVYTVADTGSKSATVSLDENKEYHEGDTFSARVWATGEVSVYLNDEVYTNFTVRENASGVGITVELADIPAGKHLMTLAVRSAGGNYTMTLVAIFSDGETYRLSENP